MRNRDYPRPRNYPIPEQESPSLLMMLIVVNIGAFLLRTLFVVDAPADATPAGFISMGELHQGHWWTVFTHMFVHLDFYHLTTNMLLLWLAGRSVLAQMGPRHFGYIYFLGGLAGTALELFVGAKGSKMELIGASGAVFAVLGAFGALFPYYSVTEKLRRWVGFRLRARSVVLGLILSGIILDVLYRFVPAGTEWPGMNISHLCHVGGGILGMIYASQARPAVPPFRRVRPSATKFLEEFTPHDEFSPFVPAGPRRRKLEQDEEDELFPIPAPEPLTDKEFLQQSVDPILDKLHKQGLASLTVEEKSVLDEAAKRLSK
jgi:membrane associated rhomboid family serine protease